jgi:hypothetical protein
VEAEGSDPAVVAAVDGGSMELNQRLKMGMMMMQLREQVEGIRALNTVRHVEETEVE